MTPHFQNDIHANIESALCLFLYEKSPISSILWLYFVINFFIKLNNQTLRHYNIDIKIDMG